MADAQGDLLCTGSAALGLALSAAQLDRLRRYADELRRWNPRARLISEQDVDRLEARHLLDSLSVLTWLPETGRLQPPRVLDFGSGGGLPGIPLAIARPELEVTLVERQQRKARFLLRMGRELALDNLAIHGAELATLTRPAGGFGVAVSRAVADPATLWRELAPLLAGDGFLLALSRVQQPAGQAPEPPLPPGARRRWVSIPGLPEPHELLRMERSAGLA